jgi:hypothetical protein
LLSSPDAPRVAQRMRLRADAEERFCDMFAAAVLLPATWVLSTHGGAPRTLATLRELADQAEASLAASVVRVNELLDWSCALFRWRRDTPVWRLAAAAGVPPHLHGQLRSSPQTSPLLSRVAAQERDQVTRARLPLMLSKRKARVDAEISVLGRTAIALLNLRSLVVEGMRPPRVLGIDMPEKPEDSRVPLGLVLSVQAGVCGCGQKTARGLIVQGINSACWETRASAATKIAARSARFYIRVEGQDLSVQARPCPVCGAPDRLVALQGDRDCLVDCAPLMITDDAEQASSRAPRSDRRRD